MELQEGHFLIIPGMVLFFFTGGAAAAAWSGPAVNSALGAARTCCRCCWASSGFIWSCWCPSLIPNSAATAAADELDAIAAQIHPISCSPTTGKPFPFGSPVLELAANFPSLQEKATLSMRDMTRTNSGNVQRRGQKAVPRTRREENTKQKGRQGDTYLICVCLCPESI